MKTNRKDEGFTRTPNFGVSSQGERGFIMRIILVIIALIALKYYFHFDVLEWINSQEGQKIIGPLITFTKNTYAYIDGVVKGWVSK